MVAENPVVVVLLPGISDSGEKVNQGGWQS